MAPGPEHIAARSGNQGIVSVSCRFVVGEGRESAVRGGESESESEDVKRIAALRRWEISDNCFFVLGMSNPTAAVKPPCYRPPSHTTNAV